MTECRCELNFVTRSITGHISTHVLGVLPVYIGQPLNCETRPFKGVCHNQVVEKRCILFPYFVFFVDNPLLHSIIIHCKYEIRLSNGIEGDVRN